MKFQSLQSAFAVADFDRYPRFMLVRYVNFVRIARGNGVSWRSIGGIGYQLFKRRMFRF